MKIVHTFGKRNVAWVKPTDMVESIEDPAHHVVGYKPNNMGIGRAAIPVAKSKVEKTKSQTKSAGKFCQLAGSKNSHLDQKYWLI